MKQDNSVDLVKARLNIVDIIGEYISLKKAGTNYTALCPFHNEKSPSFMTSEEKQIWHCFGCGNGGDLFDFIMKMEGVEFREALKMLAKKAGVKLAKINTKVENKKVLLLDINEEAALFFHNRLFSDQGAEIARNYLLKRGVSQEMIKLFCLGYSPDSWGDFRDFMLAKNYKQVDLLAAGLLVKSSKNNTFYDRFRNRLMFPIYNSFGNVVGFSARVLAEDKDKMGKYINSPQTLVYNKSAVIYGLYQAKDGIKQKGEVLFTEGQMDVISSHQAGVVNVVAASGTALSCEHFVQIKRLTKRILFCFDSDKAGKLALLRATKIALPSSLEIKVVVLSEGKDPDELIKKDPGAFELAVQEAKSVMDYYFQEVLFKLKVNDIAAKKKSVTFLLKLIKLLSSKIEQSYYLQKLSKKTNIPESVLIEEMNPSNQVKHLPRVTEEVTQRLDSIKAALEERILFLLMQKSLYWQELPEEFEGFLKDDMKAKKFYNFLVMYYNSVGNIESLGFSEIKDFFSEDPEQIPFAQRVFLLGENIYSGFSSEDLMAEFLRIMAALRKNLLNKKLNELGRELRNAEAAGDMGKTQKYLTLVCDLSKQLSGGE